MCCCVAVSGFQTNLAPRMVWLLSNHTIINCEESTMSEKVSFWFDVSCPYCWVTSRWIKEVEKVRDIEVEWIPMSLSVLNEGRDYLPEDYRRKMEANWGPARVFAAVKANHPDKVDALYTDLGTRIHKGRLRRVRSPHCGIPRCCRPAGIASRRRFHHRG